MSGKPSRASGSSPVRSKSAGKPLMIVASEDLRRNLLEATAKQAYGVWAHRVGIDTPWEHLTPAHALAWKEVVTFVHDEPHCQECGEVLLCVHCDSDIVYDCNECGETMTCPNCGDSALEGKLFDRDPPFMRKKGASK